MAKRIVKKKPNRKKVTKKKPNRKVVAKKPNRKVVKKKLGYTLQVVQDKITELKRRTANQLVGEAKEEFGVVLPLENGKGWLHAKVSYLWQRRIQGKNLSKRAIDNEKNLDKLSVIAGYIEHDCFNLNDESKSSRKGSSKKSKKGPKGPSVRQLIRDSITNELSDKKLLKVITEAMMEAKDYSKKEAKRRAIVKIKRVRKQESI